LEQWLSPLASPADLERFRRHISDASTIEEMFALLVKAMGDAEISHLDPATQLWAVIDRALSEYEIMMTRFKEQMPSKTDGIYVMDAVAPKIKDSEGNDTLFLVSLDGKETQPETYKVIAVLNKLRTSATEQASLIVLFCIPANTMSYKK
jgi:hypothetical protein